MKAQGIIEHFKGYWLVDVGPDHPLADARGYAPLAALVWVSAGNAPPPAGHDLHHRDEDKKNNRLVNLGALEHAEHARLHALERSRHEDGTFAPVDAGQETPPRHREPASVPLFTEKTGQSMGQGA